MKKFIKASRLNLVTMGTLLSLNCHAAESEREEHERKVKENQYPTHSPSKGPMKLTHAQKEQLRANQKEHERLLEDSRNRVKEPRIFDLNEESVERVCNRIGNAHVLGVKAHITLVNATAEQKEYIRKYIHQIDWKAKRFEPNVIFGDEDLKKDGGVIYLTPLETSTDKDIKLKEVDDEEDEDLKKKDKNKLDLEDDEDEDDLKPVKNVKFHLSGGNLGLYVPGNAVEPQRAARGIYYPLFSQLDPNNGQRGILAPIAFSNNASQLSWGRSSVENSNFRGENVNIPHTIRIENASLNKHQESLRKVRYFCGKGAKS